MKLQVKFSCESWLSFHYLFRTLDFLDPTAPQRGESLGTVSLSNSSRLPANTAFKLVNPVMFPPGPRQAVNQTQVAQDRTHPKNDGIVLVAFLRARAPVVAGVTSTSTLRRTTHQPGGSRSYLSSANRYSKSYVFALQHSRVYGTSRRNDSGPPPDRKGKPPAGVLWGEIQPILDLRRLLRPTEKQSAKSISAKAQKR